MTTEEEANPFLTTLQHVTDLWVITHDEEDTAAEWEYQKEAKSRLGTHGYLMFLTALETTMSALETATGHQFRYDPETGEDLDFSRLFKPRKKHVQVPQGAYLTYIEEHGEVSIEHMAKTFNVHVSTARRNLDGLMYQNKLTRNWRSPWPTTRYRLATPVITDKEHLKDLPPGKYVLKGEAAEEIRKQRMAELKEDHDN